MVVFTDPNCKEEMQRIEEIYAWLWRAAKASFRFWGKVIAKLEAAVLLGDEDK